MFFIAINTNNKNNNILCNMCNIYSIKYTAVIDRYFFLLHFCYK